MEQPYSVLKMLLTVSQRNDAEAGAACTTRSAIVQKDARRTIECYIQRRTRGAVGFPEKASHRKPT